MKKKIAPGAGVESAEFEALVRLADEQEGNQNEVIAKVTNGVVRAETWISTWPVDRIMLPFESESVDPSSTFPYAARFKVENGIVQPPSFISGADFKPSVQTQKPHDPQYWIDSATGLFLTPEQLSFIESVKFYQGEQKVVPMSVSILTYKPGSHNFRDAYGRSIQLGKKSAVNDRTRYLVFGRGKMGTHQYPITTEGIPGTGEKYLPDTFYLELTTNDSAKALLAALQPEGLVFPQILFTALSFGISSQANFQSMRAADLRQIIPYASPLNKYNPFSPNVGLKVYNNTGIK